MSSKVSFEGIGEVIATFYAKEGVEAGQVVKPDGDSTVGPCAAGEKFCGVAESVKTGCAAVRVGGFMEVACADSGVTAGWATLTADGNGGVKAAADGEVGVDCLVAAVDADGTIVVKM